jgi:hypothetical protein
MHGLDLLSNRIKRHLAVLFFGLMLFFGIRSNNIYAKVLQVDILKLKQFAAKDTVLIPFDIYNCSSCNIIIKSIAEELSSESYILKIIVNQSNERKARMQYDFNMIKDVETIFDLDLYNLHFYNAAQSILVKTADGRTHTCHFEFLRGTINFGLFNFLAKVKSIKDTLLIDMGFNIGRISENKEILAYNRTKELLFIDYESEKITSLDQLTEDIYLEGLRKVVKDDSLYHINLQNQDQLMGHYISYMNIFGSEDSSIYLISDLKYLKEFTKDRISIAGAYIISKLNYDKLQNKVFKSDLIIYPDSDLQYEEITFFSFRSNIIQRGENLFQGIQIKEKEGDNLVRRADFTINPSNIDVLKHDSLRLDFDYSHKKFNSFVLCDCKESESKSIVGLRHDFYFQDINDGTVLNVSDNFSNYNYEIPGTGSFQYFIDKCIIHNGYLIVLNGCKKNRYEIICYHIENKKVAKRIEIDTTDKHITLKYANKEPLIYLINKEGEMEVFKIIL